MAKGTADTSPVCLGLDVGHERAAEVDGHECDRRIDRIEQISAVTEQEPRRGGDQSDSRHGCDGCNDRAGPSDQARDAEAAQDQEHELGPGRERRALEMLAGQHLLERLRVDLDSWHRGLQRGRAQIEKAGRGGADEDMTAGHVLGVERAVDDLEGGDVAAEIGRGEVEPQLAVGVRWQNAVADCGWSRCRSAGRTTARRYRRTSARTACCPRARPGTPRAAATGKALRLWRGGAARGARSGRSTAAS